MVSIVLTALAVAVLGSACGSSSSEATHLDPRALVAQPRDVGGIRGASGAFTELADDGVYPLPDALGGKPGAPDIAFAAGYPGAAGKAYGADVEALAVVLPTVTASRKLLADTSRVEGFIGEVSVDVSPSAPPGKADAAVLGVSPRGAVIAWTRGTLYGFVAATGRAAESLARRVARAQEVRFERAAGGDRLSVDPLLLPAPAPSGLPVVKLRTVQPTTPTLRIERAGRYTLRDLGVGALTFAPSASLDGVQVPVTFALPASANGRWLWRVTTHVIVTLAPGAPLGGTGVSSRVGNTGGPGVNLLVADDLANGTRYLIDPSRHTSTTTRLEVSVRAMLGGSPSPRQRTTVAFFVGTLLPGRPIERVTVLPDSSIEVFSDPAKIGRLAVSTLVSRALP